MSDQKEFNLGKSLAETLKKYFILILIVAVAVGVISGMMKKRDYVQKYNAIAKVAITTDPAEYEMKDEDVSKLIRDEALYDSIIALSSVNLSKVAEDTGVPCSRLQAIANDNIVDDGRIKSGMINCFPKGNVVIIHYTSSNKDETLAIVNSIAKNLIDSVEEVSGKTNLKIIDMQTSPRPSGSFSMKQPVVSGVATGFILMWVVLVLLDYRKKTK